MRRTGNVIFLSDRDAACAAKFCAGLRSMTMPPVFDYKPSSRPSRKAGTTLQLGFLGNFGWWPNRVGLRWFATEVLPQVKSALRLHLYGPGSDTVWKGDPRIVGHGVVEQMDQIWQTCDFLICPSFSNAGVCVKLVEAMYNGIPVLATRDAARGLPLGNDPALVLLDAPGEWVEFLDSAAARDLVGRQVSEKMAGQFSIDSHKDVFQQFVSDVISRRAHSGPAA
jgi:glycosyltransferase involved in cell wall biosynthesis